MVAFFISSTREKKVSVPFPHLDVFTNFAHITQKINIKRQMNTFKKCCPT